MNSSGRMFMKFLFLCAASTFIVEEQKKRRKDSCGLCKWLYALSLRSKIILAFAFICILVAVIVIPVVVTKSNAGSSTAPTASTNITAKTVTLCEGYSQVLVCGGQYIQVINATFGRTDKSKCTPTGTEINVNNCTTNATKYLSFKCNNRRGCPLTAQAEYFGDPCKGITKYLTVIYKCNNEPGVIPTTIVLPTIPTATANSKNNTAGCGKVIKSTHANRVRRVVSGTNANPGSWPWQVAIYHTSDDSFLCGGSLLNELWFTTAAHCVFGSVGSELYVVIGDTDRSIYENTEWRYNIDRVETHPDYDGEYNNDIALVKLQRNVSFSNFISPVCLPTSPTNITEKPKCFITGWGKTDFAGRASIKLQQGIVYPVTRQKCQIRLENSPASVKSTITEKQLCVGGTDTPLPVIPPGVTSCQGDSGGPLVYNDKDSWILIGVISWGPRRCALEDMYTVTTNVFSYLTWINGTIW